MSNYFSMSFYRNISPHYISSTLYDTFSSKVDFYFHSDFKHQAEGTIVFNCNAPFDSHNEGTHI